MKSKILTFLLFLLSAASWGQAPQWVGNTPQELNHTYKFVEIISYGSTVDQARVKSKEQLAQDEQLIKAVSVNVETGKLTRMEQTYTNGDLSEVVKEKVDINVNISGKPFKLQAFPVDMYYRQEQGQVKLHTLYMVAVEDDPVFDRTYLTTSYGAKPVVMSIIPGLGQWYKGSKVKGICLFGAEALCVAGILISDNQKASYERKIVEQPRFVKDYRQKADNWESARNVFIGAAAVVWVYNMVDAAVAKGARRVVVKRADGGDLSVRPMAAPSGAGVTFAYRF